MRRRTAFPFLTLPPEAVSFGGWLIGDPGEPLLAAEDLLENWDYERDLEVAVEVTIDPEGAAAALGFQPNDLHLTAVMRAGTGTGTLPRRSDLLATGPICAATPGVALTSAIDARKLSGRLRLELGLVLDKVPTERAPLSPAMTGARLWGARRDILIEDGGDSRFPIELVSFAEFFPGAPHMHSPWYVDWRAGDLHADFGGSVRLYVNSDFPEAADRVVEGDPLTLQAMVADVISQIVESVLEMVDIEDALADCADGSVGQQIRGWLDLAFPGQSLSSVRAMSVQLPGRFRGALLSASDMREST